MSGHSHRHCPPTAKVVGKPKVIFQDQFHEQLVEVIHPVEIVLRHHFVPVHTHKFSFHVREEVCPPPTEHPAHIKRNKKR
ncbi:hypothetical protein E5161_06955 [Cohnella pontilimi]|uniref:Spore coat protein D n=1 Tax=Cohnella pontilimi TaxID=2564100 RepID=A0A4U0FCX9_9BACL|nr:hypothetical protein E5161_06955 [Cohnella pontilimi]